MWQDETGLVTKDRVKAKKPSNYKVIMHNDHYTTMEFVIQILVQVFKKTVENATAIMLDVHQKGFGVAGVYSKDIAETKVNTVHEKARVAGFPLKCTVEKD